MLISIDQLSSKLDDGCCLESDQNAIEFSHSACCSSYVDNTTPAKIWPLTPPSADIQTIPPIDGSINPRYYPIVYPNTFWQLKGHSYPINETVA